MSSLMQFIVIWMLNGIIHHVGSITISTSLGEIKGVSNSAAWPGTTLYEFMGIGYATPPLGNLRFRPAILNATKWNGVYDATKFGSVCIQSNAPNGQTMGEDCLYLNIWTTKENVDNKNNKLVPVILFIHGGAFVSGEGSDAGYSGLNFVGEDGGNFVYVSINYRLGPLGWLANEEIAKEDPSWKSNGGMNGLYDQITAIKYVKQFIADYGGDPNEMSIFGESAGALSVCYILVSAQVPANLFQRSISESGSCIGPWGPLTADEGIAYCNGQLINAGYPINNLTYLRSIPAQTFNDKVTADPWNVTVDGVIITDLPRNLYSKPDFKVNADEAVIFGFNSIDGIVSFPFHAGPAPKNDVQYKSFIAKYITNTTQQKLVHDTYYPPSNFPQYEIHNSYELAWYSINGDVCVSCPTILVGEQLSMNQETAKVYLYEFLGSGNQNQYYAPHASELAFVFDEKDDVFEMPWSQNLSDSMVSAWTNYAKYGVPNITNSFEKIDIVWNEFDIKDENVILFKEGDGGISNKKDFKQNYRNNVCDFWNNQVGIDIMIPLCNAYWGT